MKQASIIIAKKDFFFRKTGSRGKPVIVTMGDRFMVTSPMYMNMTSVKIDRVKKARLNEGYNFPLSMISEYFEIVE